MQYTSHYDSPFGRILLACDDCGLTGLWFEGAKYFAESLSPEHCEENSSFFDQGKRWLDIYFSGKKPDFTPPLHLTGSAFRLAVWEELLQIPYGETTTYGEISRLIARRRSLPRISAQAVGGAVGRNRISLIVPCHRVIGANGSLTGYAGGLRTKAALLALEKSGMPRL